MLFPVTICVPDLNQDYDDKYTKLKTGKSSFYPVILRIGCKQVYQY